MVLVFYFLNIVLMIIIRPILNNKFLKNGKSALYSALYFLPIIALLHTVVGGLVCEYQDTYPPPSNVRFVNSKYDICFYRCRLCVPIFEHHHIDGIECSAFLHEARSDDEIVVHDIIY